MKIHILLLLIILVFLSSCREEEVILKPFELNRELTCDDLEAQGYRWSPGVDVILIGKIYENTAVYYQLEHDDCDFLEGKYYKLRNWAVGTQRGSGEYFLYEDDSIFLDKFYEYTPRLCECASVYWRNFIVHVQPKDTVSIEQMINNDKKPLESWVPQYGNTLKPKLAQRRYRWLDKEIDWRHLNLPKNACWGGAATGEILTDHLIANELELYSSLEHNELMRTLRVIPDTKGELLALEKFWESEEGATADPILVYADLLSEKTNPRYMETAN